MASATGKPDQYHLPFVPHVPCHLTTHMCPGPPTTDESCPHAPARGVLCVPMKALIRLIVDRCLCGPEASPSPRSAAASRQVLPKRVRIGPILLQGLLLPPLSRQLLCLLQSLQPYSDPLSPWANCTVFHIPQNTPDICRSHSCRSFIEKSEAGPHSESQ